MDAERESGHLERPKEPRRFVSSIPLGEPSRRSQVLMWIFIGLCLAAVTLVGLLYWTSGFGLWFSR
ncbi:MAG TPA: hypothetical protein VMU20_11680 [Candidatus Dormibacteraeota bacterium]|nr:hypothetical protein [Candidatus Dormibacteraeota bacterium]